MGITKHVWIVLINLTVTTLASSQIQFRTENYEAIKQDAIDSKKLLFIDFRAAWCKPCLEMEKTTFQDADLSVYVHERYIPVKADVDFSFFAMDLKEKYNVNSLPTILILDPNSGEVYLRIIGAKPASHLMEDLKSLEQFTEESEIEVPDTIEKEVDQPKKKRCKLFKKRKDTTFYVRTEELMVG